MLLQKLVGLLWKQQYLLSSFHVPLCGKGVENVSASAPIAWATGTKMMQEAPDSPMDLRTSVSLEQAGQTRPFVQGTTYE